jgi:hypothetical protein
MGPSMGIVEFGPLYRLSAGRKTMKKFLSLMGLLGALSVSGAAHAQLAGLTHVHSVPGVLNNGAGVATIIACTNGGTSTATIGVEVYGSTGTYVSGGSLPVASKATILFATSAVTNQSVDVNVNTGVLTKGHARVVGSTTRGIVCSPYLVETATGAPLAALAIMKKYTQK